MEIRKVLELNENEDTTYQNWWDITKTVLGKIYSTECLYSKRKKFQIIDLIFQFKKLEKGEHVKPKVNRKRK